MMRFGVYNAIAVLLFLAIGAQCDEPKIDPKAEVVLNRISAVYDGLESYRDKTRAEVAVVWGGSSVPFVVKSSLAFARPGKLVIEAKSEFPAGNGALIFDGDTYWIYRGDLRQYRKTKVLDDQSASDAVFAANIVGTILREGADWKSEEDDNGFIAAVYGGKESVSGTQTDVAKLILENGYVKLWAGPDGVVRQAELELNVGAGIFVKVNETHTDVELDPQIGPTDFAFAIPEGAIAVESFGKEPKLEAGMAAEFPQAEGLIPNGEPAPGFSLKDLDGKVAALSDMKGNVVLIDFWATWCGPCRMEMPEIQKIHDDLKGKGLIVLGIDNETDTEMVKRFLSENEYTYPTLIDPDHKTGGEYRVSGIPTVYIIDKEGNVAASLVGYSPDRGTEIREVLAKLGVE